MENLKKEPWRIVVGLISIAYIVFLWGKKDISGIYATMPPEQVAPLIVTTVLVSLAKVAAIVGGILLIKWRLGKGKKS